MGGSQARGSGIEKGLYQCEWWLEGDGSVLLKSLCLLVPDIRALRILGLGFLDQGWAFHLE